MTCSRPACRVCCAQRYIDRLIREAADRAACLLYDVKAGGR